MSWKTGRNSSKKEAFSTPEMRLFSLAFVMPLERTSHTEKSKRFSKKKRLLSSRHSFPVMLNKRLFGDKKVFREKKKRII